MTLCPIAILSSCKKCPLFSICPLKGIIGDYKKNEEKCCCKEKDNEKSKDA